MSMVEEDVELRDLLAQTLEKNGCLAKLRAELRASIFLALDEDVKLSTHQPLQNLRVQSYLQTPEGRTMFCLVREFLEFFNLQFTISVYEPESFLDCIGQYEGRHKVAKDLGLENMEEPTVPLLQLLLKIAQSKSNILDINLNLNGSINGSFKDEDSSFRKTETGNNTSRSLNNTQLILEENHITEQNGMEANSEHSVDASRIREELSIIEEVQLIADVTGNISKTSINNTIPLPDEFIASLEQNGTFNMTYDLNSPTVNVSQMNENKNRNVNVPKCLKDIKEDDTYEDTSSIPEDSETLDKHSSVNVEFENDVPYKNPSNSNSENANQLSPKLSSPTDKTKPDIEKAKVSPQRSKASLSALSDLPPLPLNKTRVSNDILPSLYNKDFKNKSNLKELDKMFDTDADYEEDFMYSNELSLKSASVNSKQSMEETFNSNKTDLDVLNMINKKDSKNSPPNIGKSVLKPIQTNNCSIKTDDSNESSINEYTSESVNSAQ